MPLEKRKRLRAGEPMSAIEHFDTQFVVGARGVANRTCQVHGDARILIGVSNNHPHMSING
jgi:hypothetical protein